MHVVGRLLTREELLRCLRTRLLLARELDAKPAIADERIEAPLIVTGPARSGTTILFELLWLDPALRGPTAWEALHPVAAARARRRRERGSRPASASRSCGPTCSPSSRRSTSCARTCRSSA